MSARILLSDGTWKDDSFRVVRETPQSVAACDVIPLASFRALDPAQRRGVGVWLTPDNEPRELAPFADRLALIAVDFPAFKDGRGFSTATLLRTRYGFLGDLRAIGDVLIDQLFYMRRVGFTSFAVRADQDPERAVAALRTFTDVYQAGVDQPLPYFRRRAAAGVRT
jgi:uncharacterized protein (DUF934 family)